ncbi:MAG TPA: HEAT repeat domain-containing protein [Pirellulales bacterium]|nr:HEAT repeat domain-containing protein [Pirellulales bacterium]
MRSSFAKRLVPLGLCLLWAVTAGCARTKTNKKWYDPFGLFPAEEEEGRNVVTPADWIKRWEALAKEAKDMPPAEQERASTELAGALNTEEDPLLRSHMLRTLAAFPTKTAEAMLSAGMQDGDHDVRVACCEAWGKRGGEKATQILCETLKSDTDLDVRLAAARVLGDLKDAKAAPALGLALDEPFPALRYRAIESLKKISGKDYTDLKSWREYAQGGEPKELSRLPRWRRIF